MPEEFEGSEGPDNLDQPPSFFPYSGQLPEGKTGDLGELVEVHIQGVFAADTEQSKSLFVLVSDGDRKLPIIIGPFEAQAISLPLENSQPERPMTHDLIRNILDRFDATVERVVIDDLWNGIYYAKLYVKRGKVEFEIDARPSDAIALAVRFDAPVFVADGILEAGSEE
ncbi:MAG: bifunctional nuclease family protein [Fimbriimonadaceae bacterium]